MGAPDLGAMTRSAAAAIRVDHPEQLWEQWFRFWEVRARRRALDRLQDAGLISAQDAERGRTEHPDPILIADPLATAVAVDLADSAAGGSVGSLRLTGAGRPHRRARRRDSVVVSVEAWIASR